MNITNHSTYNFDLSENVAYNTPSFPAYLRDGLLSMYPDYTAGSHWHEDLEFIFIRSGSMTYNVNGQLTELTAGNGIFVNSRQIHYGFSATRCECDFFCILLHPSLLSANKAFQQRYVDPLLHNENCPYVQLDASISWHQEILCLLTDMFRMKEKETAMFVIQRHFFHIFELLCCNLPSATASNEVTSMNQDTLKSMVLFIQEHYQEKLTLSDIAKSGSCCKSKCSALFMRYFKESPIIYLNKYRLKVSCRLLQEQKLSITEIALECGFHGASYFCETFHKYYGFTPHDYRRKYRT